MNARENVADISDPQVPKSASLAILHCPYIP